MHSSLEADRIASSLFLLSPDEAYETALDFLDGALCAKDRELAVTWTTVLTLLEKMQLDYQVEPGFIPELRSSSMM